MSALSLDLTVPWPTVIGQLSFNSVHTAMITSDLGGGGMKELSCVVSDCYAEEGDLGSYK